jgi:5-methylcytosine-specific restriction endonuclease McrA
MSSPESDPSTKKKINIVGKNNRFHMRKLTEGNENKTRRENIINQIDESFYNHDIQRHLIQCIHENEIRGNPIPVEYEQVVPVVLSEISKKVSSYRMQDKIQKRPNIETVVTQGQTTHLLRDSELTCYYCKDNVFLLYKQVREMSQWSLDRLDNSVVHCLDNVVISCLDCNLRKRTRGADKFRETKQMVLVKEAEPETRERVEMETCFEPVLEPEDMLVHSNIEYSQCS